MVMSTVAKACTKVFNGTVFRRVQRVLANGKVASTMSCFDLAGNKFSKTKIDGKVVAWVSERPMFKDGRYIAAETYKEDGTKLMTSSKRIFNRPEKLVYDVFGKTKIPTEMKFPTTTISTDITLYNNNSVPRKVSSVIKDSAIGTTRHITDVTPGKNTVDISGCQGKLKQIGDGFVTDTSGHESIKEIPTFY